MRLTPEQRADRLMLERTLQDRIVARARRRGWMVYHAGVGFTKAGFRTQGTPGWPDLTLVRPGNRVLFMELKRELGKTKVEQDEWLAALGQTGNWAGVIRPSDLRLGLVTRLLDGEAG